jgi:hypothetical protein
MKIKPPQKRIEFERFLLSLGIRDRNPIIYPKNIGERILEDIYPELQIYFLVKNYKNKKSYLYEYFKNNSKEKTKLLYNRLKIGEKNRVGEIIWTIHGNTKRLTASDNKIILLAFVREMKKRTSIGICGEIPRPNDILMCRPVNNQIIEVPENFIIGANHKASLYKRLGFGELDEDLRQYAIYDENMILHPI